MISVERLFGDLQVCNIVLSIKVSLDVLSYCEGFDQWISDVPFFVNVQYV